jgi:ClpX C4-type zinc finger
MDRWQVTPPPIIDSARTLCYAVNDDDVLFTNRIHLIVGSERLGEVPHLAICQNYGSPGDILLLFCDASWESKGVIAFDSIEAAKAKAESGYQGISGKWVDVETSKEEIDRFLRDEYQVDPETEWWKVCCSFRGKEDTETTGMLASNKANICYECVKDFYTYVTEEK